MSLTQRDQQHHTYGEYCGWPEDVRYELVDGQAHAMTPGPNRRHQELVVEMLRQVADALEGSPCRVYQALEKLPVLSIVPGTVRSRV